MALSGISEKTKKLLGLSTGEDEPSKAELRAKINKSYGIEDFKINPFLTTSGELVNPYIDYQKILDNPNVATNTKAYIQDATGLSPTASAARAGSAIASSASFENFKQSGSDIVKAAGSYIGTPYVWGGESMSEGGMDCSGFVYNALKDAGYNVVRDTAEGYRQSGTSVDRSNLQAGDLIFYGSGSKAAHVGIYIGNGKVIQSSGNQSNTKNNPGQGVCIKNIDYRSDYMGAKRYTKGG